MKKKYTEEEARAMPSSTRRYLRSKGFDVPLLKPGAPKGYKQTKEHIAKRIKSGEDHPNWKGNSITQKSGRSRAIRMYPNAGTCVICNKGKGERHHIDGNTINNTPENILMICRKCHMKKDGRYDEFIELARKNQPKAVAARWS